VGSSGTNLPTKPNARLTKPKIVRSFFMPYYRCISKFKMPLRIIGFSPNPLPPAV
jgi:hypothetical protein